MGRSAPATSATDRAIPGRCDLPRCDHRRRCCSHRHSGHAHHALGTIHHAHVHPLMSVLGMIHRCSRRRTRTLRLQSHPADRTGSRKSRLNLRMHRADIHGPSGRRFFGRRLRIGCCRPRRRTQRCCQHQTGHPNSTSHEAPLNSRALKTHGACVASRTNQVLERSRVEAGFFQCRDQLRGRGLAGSVEAHDERFLLRVGVHRVDAGNLR